MADLLDGFARYLHGLGLVAYDELGIGGDVFADAMPEAPDEAVVLTLYGLGEPDPLNEDDVSGLQVRARGPAGNAAPSRLRCQAIYSALQGLAGVTLPDGTLLLLCTAVQTPSSLGVDSNGRYEHVVNFRICVVNPTANRS